MFTLPTLNFEYDALEPAIDKKTMEIHHTKHHQSYIDKANAALSGTDWEGHSACDILRNLEGIPEDIRSAVENNVGGHCNHSFFWTILSPKGGGAPVGNLAEALNDTFDSFNGFKERFSSSAAARFGSGWAWLVMKDNKLEIISTANQDSPLSLGYTRIIGLDVWEHAYYLNYQNRRPDYISAFWNIVDWQKAEEYFTKGGI